MQLMSRKFAQKSDALVSRLPQKCPCLVPAPGLSNCRWSGQSTVVTPCSTLLDYCTTLIILYMPYLNSLFTLYLEHFCSTLSLKPYCFGQNIGNLMQISNYLSRTSTFDANAPKCHAENSDVILFKTMVYNQHNDLVDSDFEGKR